MVTKASVHFIRWIREAVIIRKTGSKAMSRDIRTYNLSHTYDSLVIQQNIKINGPTKTIE